LCSLLLRNPRPACIVLKRKAPGLTRFTRPIQRPATRLSKAVRDAIPRTKPSLTGPDRRAADERVPDLLPRWIAVRVAAQHSTSDRVRTGGQRRAEPDVTTSVLNRRTYAPNYVQDPLSDGAASCRHRHAQIEKRKGVDLNPLNPRARSLLRIVLYRRTNPTGLS